MHVGKNTSYLRSLAMILLLTFAVAFVPPPAWAAFPKLEYNYLKLHISGNTGTDVTTITSFEDLEEKTSNNQVSDPWHYVGVGNGCGFRFANGGYAMLISGNANAPWASVKLQVPQDGLYTAYSLHAYLSMSPIVEFFLAPEAAENPRAPEFLVNTVDFYGPQTGGTPKIQSVPLGTLELTAGNYILSYRIPGRNSACTGWNGCLRGFRLYKADSLASFRSLTAEPVPTLLLNGQATVPLTATMTDKSVNHLAGCEVQAVVRDADIAEAELIDNAYGLGKSLRISALSPGSTAVDVTVSKDGALLTSCQVPVTVSEGSKIVASLSLNLTRDRLGVGRATTSGVTATMTDGITKEFDVPGLTYASANPAVATVDADGRVTARSIGTTSITVSYVQDGKTITGEAALTVVERELIWNFMKLDLSRAAGSIDLNFNHQGIDPTTVTSLEQTTSGSAEEINPKSFYVTEPWCFSGMKNASLKFRHSTHGLYLLYAKEPSWVQFRIRVPESGVFRAKSNHSSWAQSPHMRFYLAPADASDPMAAQYSLGSLDTYAATTNPPVSPPVGLDAVSLTAGDYLLTYEVASLNPLNPYTDNTFCFQDFQLERLPELPNYRLTSSGGTALNPGTAKNVSVQAADGDGIVNDLYGAAVTVESLDSSVATASLQAPDSAALQRAVTITGLKPGHTQIRVSASKGGKAMEPVLIPVTVKTPVIASLNVAVESLTLNLNQNGVQITATGLDPDGDPLYIDPSDIRFTVSDPHVISVTPGGLVQPVGVGRAAVQVSVALGGTALSETLEFTVNRSKSASTYYTEEKVHAARENVQTYAWAREELESARETADQYVDLAETLWSMIPAEGIPRALTVGFKNGMDNYTCRLCGVDLRANYGSYAWNLNPLSNPWQIQCPDCRRWFPSNDFESFYKLGLDEHGVFDSKLAHARNDQLIAEGKPGYLVNIRHPDADTKFGVKNWGVDDGWGYDTGKRYANGVAEVHTYIPYYVHYGLWIEASGNTSKTGLVLEALTSLRNAYLYTGDAKYGRTGAILLDRIADLYPDYSTRPFATSYFNNDGGRYTGRILGCIWEPQLAAEFALSYDAFYPVYEDAQVLRFLQDKAQAYQLENDKSNAELIRRNAENGLLREVFKGCRESDIYGNFGMHQRALALSAVVLDSQPETGEMLDWLMQSSTWTKNANTGGDMQRTLIEKVDRDGFGQESGAGYNSIWVDNSYLVAEALAGYQYQGKIVDFYQNPKFYKMLTAYSKVMLLGKGTPAIGDSGSGNGTMRQVLKQEYLTQAFQQTGDPFFAQLVWYLNGNTAQGIRGDIFTKDPEALADRVRAVIEQTGQWDYGNSQLLAGYGFSSLLDGDAYPTAKDGPYDRQRDFWLYWGGAVTHKHFDTLNLGLEAYGVCLAPDYGYPEATQSDPHRHQSVNPTLSHNTVVIDEKSQDAGSAGAERGAPLHFDGASSRVQLMDVDAAKTYASVADAYRRTVVMVNVDDEVSYGVDFFHVQGGSDHLYSFHAMSDTVTAFEGPALVPQVDENGEYTGSYAGLDIPWGADPWTDPANANKPLQFPHGYTWLRNVRRANQAQTGEFAVDFQIMNWRNAFPRPMDLHLRVTMLNPFALDEITLADGTPPRTAHNPEKYTFLLARRKGTDLDSLFTAVYEPYCGKRYLTSMSALDMELVSGTPGPSRAVKIAHENGRVDYVLYSTDTAALYKITDGDMQFYFRGFAGVYTLYEGEVVYRYLNDGDILGTEVPAAEKEYAGTVVDFTRDLAFDNFITVSVDGDPSPAILAGKHIYVENDGVFNAVYQIEAARALKDGSVELALGNCTLIRKLQDPDDISAGYIYNIAEGQRFRIPLSFEEDTAPVFQPVGDYIISAGRRSTLAVQAESPADRKITYRIAEAPRGVQVDPSTGTVTWIPDANQLGQQLIAIRADDGALSSVLHIKVTVVNQAAGGPSAALHPKPGTEPGAEPDTGSQTKPDTHPTPNNNKKFVDLGSYAWAEDAIYDLVERGIVKGTSETTFSPSQAVTRADFAILLVRAFHLTGSASENFFDVSTDAYYASEVATAKASGIIEGIGDNRFAPEAAITREDMMLILKRVLEKTGKPLAAADLNVLADFLDGAQVSPYARPAAAQMVSEGLIVGSGGYLHPQGLTTRAEAAVLLQRILIR